MFAKVIAHKQVKAFWLFIDSLRSGNVLTAGAGTLAVLRRAGNVLAEIGAQEIGVMGLTSRCKGIASPFSNDSAYALDESILDPFSMPELNNNSERKQKLEHLLRELPVFERSNAANQKAIHMEHLREAYEVFLNNKSINPLINLYSPSQRLNHFDVFKVDQKHWLDHYAVFRALKDQNEGKPWYEWENANEYRNINGDAVQSFILSHQKEIDFYKFAQFELYRQTKETFADLHKKGLKIETFVGVGVSRDSAEGLFMHDKFDDSRQIGCDAEPENGYPLQLWGFLAPKLGPAYDKYNTGRFSFMKELGADHIVGDHGAGMFGGYITFPYAHNVSQPGTWMIPVGEEEKRIKHAIAVMGSLLSKGIELTVETVGDGRRRIAAEFAIQYANLRGHPLKTMRSLPWEDTWLNKYLLLDRLSLTHDMPSVPNILTNVRGGKSLGMAHEQILRFASKLRLPLSLNDLPLKEAQLNPFLFKTIFSGLYGSCTAGTISMPFANLFTLDPMYAMNAEYLNTNVLPGTSGDFDPLHNTLGNWMTMLPPIEKLAKQINEWNNIFDRAEAVSPFTELSTINSAFRVLSAPLDRVKQGVPTLATKKNTSFVHEGSEGQLGLFDLKGYCRKKGIQGSAIAELIVSNRANWHEKAVIPLDFISTSLSSQYVFTDLRTGEHHVHTREQLMKWGGLYVELDKVEGEGPHTHHFVVYEQSGGENEL